ncbi:MAG: lyase HEAT-like repeat-containing protein [archaeon]|jgi:deoxyhypusine monooxygenase
MAGEITAQNLTEDDYARIILDLNKTKEERIQAAFHLENAIKDENIKALITALFTDPSPIVRHEVAFSLGESAHPRLAAKYLMKAVEEDSNIFVRHEAILALGTLGKKEFIPFVKKFLRDKEPEMVESAEIALERLEH